MGNGNWGMFPRREVSEHLQSRLFTIERMATFLYNAAIFSAFFSYRAVFACAYGKSYKIVMTTLVDLAWQI